MSKRPLLIVGNGEIASMALQYFRMDSVYEPVAFAIGADYKSADTFEDLPLLDLEAAYEHYPSNLFAAFVAIGDTQLNRVRARHFLELKNRGYQLASYVSSAAFVWPNMQIGENCFILEHNVLQPYVKIGDNVVLWSGNHIGHRTEIEEHVFITSHVVVSGFCTIGSGSYIGVNCAVAHQVSVGKDNFIAMSSAIAASTEPDGVYQGNPAERRKVSAKRFCRVRND